uniref:Uncharacterized protein n=1 Tax=viral metagenome TaxID=1070528 RepID=A0A6M3XJE4_9ZZZZ
MANIKSSQQVLSEQGPAIQFGTIATGTAGRWVAFSKAYPGTPGVIINRMTGGMTAQAGTVTTSGIIRTDRINPGSFKLTPDSGTPTVWWTSMLAKTNL